MPLADTLTVKLMQTPMEITMVLSPLEEYLAENTLVTPYTRMSQIVVPLVATTSKMGVKSLATTPMAPIISPPHG